jgi:hypothetical protein
VLQCVLAIRRVYVLALFGLQLLHNAAGTAVVCQKLTKHLYH